MKGKTQGYVLTIYNTKKIFNCYLTFPMNTYCYYPCFDLYKYTKPHRQGIMYKYTLLKNRNFRCKEHCKQILQNSIFFSLFSGINFT